MATREAKTLTNLSPGDSMWVKNNVYDLKDIPEPPVKWTHPELGHDKSTRVQLSNRNLVVKHDYEDMSVQKRRQYSATREFYNAIQTWLAIHEESDGLLPCGHDGFKNHGETLECRRCGAIHKKEVVR